MSYSHNTRYIVMLVDSKTIHGLMSFKKLGTFMEEKATQNIIPTERLGELT